MHTLPAGAIKLKCMQMRLPLISHYDLQDITYRNWPTQCRYDVTGWSDISSVWGLIILQIIKTDH